MARLTIHTKYGTWRQAPVNPLRLVQNAAIALRNRWSTDAEGYIKGGTAITVRGTNRYNGQPVDANGATFDLWMRVHELADQFPWLPKQVARSVDRRQNHNPNNPVSDHAKGKASDQYPISKARGWELVDHLDAVMDAAPVVTSFEGRKTQAGYDYWVWDGHARNAGGKRRALKPTSNQHRDHVHISVGLVDRRNQATSGDPTPTKPPKAKDPRRTLRYRGRWAPKVTGDDVRLVQEVVGAQVDGWFGPRTRAAVMAWQREHGLVVDGIVGPSTWAAIDRVATP